MKQALDRILRGTINRVCSVDIQSNSLVKSKTVTIPANSGQRYNFPFEDAQYSIYPDRLLSMDNVEVGEPLFDKSGTSIYFNNEDEDDLEVEVVWIDV